MNVSKTPTVYEADQNNIATYRLGCYKITINSDGSIIPENNRYDKLNNLDDLAKNIADGISCDSPFHETPIGTTIYDINIVYQNDDSFDKDKDAYRQLFIYYHLNDMQKNK